MEAFLQLGPVKGEKDIEHVLGRVRVPYREISLQQVEPGGRTVSVGHVPRGDEFDDLLHMTVGPEVAGNRHEHVGAISSARQHLLVDRHRTGQVLGLEFLARCEQACFHSSHDGGTGRRFRGRRRPCG